MHIQYYKEYSRRLEREMEFKVYGHGGKPVLAVPCQDGRFYDWENFGMVDTLSDYLDGGKIQLFTVDTIDAQSVSEQWGNPYYRVRRHEAWYNYVIEELIPRIHAINGTGQMLLSTGLSMGAYHAANFFFRRPDLFDSLIALSGIYDTQDMYGGYMDEVVYANDPCVSLSGMPQDHPYISLFNQRTIILCVGQGAWEDQLLAGTRRLDEVLRRKGIHAWVDYWGKDSDHDWPWWKRQMRYFLPHVVGEP
ncbi:MAG TPA: esterase [Candidatus Flavonifractor merdigallinarum]|uniref:Esterase n=1 Tax=Candidatus Flavonifractor merdigallinarum TaxID=2838589 RepID=A0A9D1Y6J3_9FIRM|nr:esterase [Candidatus Flavonifractor merdigallinarum]